MTTQSLQVVDGFAVGFLPDLTPDAPLFCRLDQALPASREHILTQKLFLRGLRAEVHRFGAEAAVVIQPPVDTEAVVDAIREAMARINQPEPRPDENHCLVTHAALKKALTAVKRFAATRSCGISAGTVLLASRDGRLALTATDGELAGMAVIDAETVGDWSLVVCHKWLTEWLTCAAGERLAMYHGRSEYECEESTYDPESLTMVQRTVTRMQDELVIEARRPGGASLVGLTCLDADEYPAVPKPAGTEYRLSVDAKAFKVELNKALVCAGTDETRAKLCTVNFEFEPGRLTLWSTDTHRLIEITLDAPADTPAMFFSVRADKLKKLMGAMPGRGQCDWLFGPTLVGIDLGEVVATAPVYATEPPVNRARVNQRNPNAVRLRPEGLAAKVKAAAIVSREDNRKLIVRLAENMEELHLHAASTKIGMAESMVPCKADRGDDWQLDPTDERDREHARTCEIAFNADYLLAGLAACGDSAELYIVAPNHPARLRGGNVDCTLMPMQMG